MNLNIYNDTNRPKNSNPKALILLGHGMGPKVTFFVSCWSVTESQTTLVFTSLTVLARLGKVIFFLFSLHIFRFISTWLCRRAYRLRTLKTHWIIWEFKIEQFNLTKHLWSLASTRISFINTEENHKSSSVTLSKQLPLYLTDMHVNETCNIMLNPRNCIYLSNI